MLTTQLRGDVVLLLSTTSLIPAPPSSTHHPVIATKTKWIVFVFTLFMALGVLQLLLSIFYGPTASNVSWYGRSPVVKAVSVQASNDSMTWRDISCGARPCVFNTRPADAERSLLVSKITQFLECKSDKMGGGALVSIAETLRHT